MARHFEQHVLPWLQRSDFTTVISQIVDRNVVHFDNHVAARKFDVFAKTSRFHLGDDNTCELAHAQLAGDVRRKFLDVQAELARFFSLIGLFFGVDG